MEPVVVPQTRMPEDGDVAPVLFHNPWLEPKGQQLVRLAEGVSETVEAVVVRGSSRKPRKDAVDRRRLVIRNVVSSLAESCLSGRPESAIAIDARKLAKSRYDCRDFHKDVFTSVIGDMERVRLLEITPAEFHKRRTTIRPTVAFIELLEAFGVTAADIGVRPGGEVVELKASIGHRSHKQLIDYADTAETERLRDEVTEITTCINRADLRLGGLPMPPVFLRRIFQIEAPDAPHRFDRHGRLWGGWWQNLKSDLRPLITIDGQPICDLDFKGCFLNLAYCRMGATLPNGDPYELEGLDAAYRPALKKAFSTLLFRNGDKRARLPADIRAGLPSAWTMPRLIEAFSKKHPAIAPLFNTGVGLEIMHTESQILVAALLTLARQGIPALGMHDGLAVARNRRVEALSAMKQASLSTVGVELPVAEKTLPILSVNSPPWDMGEGGL